MISVLSGPRRSAIAGSIAAALSLGALAALPATVSTATVIAQAQQIGRESCNGDVCVFMDVGGGTATFYAGAEAHRFRGYFHLSGRGVRRVNSPAREWGSHGLRTLHDFWIWQERANAGRYCASAWSEGRRIGNACVTNP
jgi:hypothetical protein